MNSTASKAAVLAACLAVAALAADSVAAAPEQRRVNVFANTNNTFTPDEFQVDPGEEIRVELNNADYFGGRHDIVFELDGGRIVRSKVLTAFLQTDTIEFTAPTILGGYVYYSSVGSQRQQGMEGTMWVGDPPTATEDPEVTATPTDEPESTATVTNAPTATATISGDTATPPTSTPTPTPVDEFIVLLPLAEKP